MDEISIVDLGLKIGLEIHQQLDTNRKLFCNCTPLESDEYPIEFKRKLRLSRSELGEFDPAVIFEKSKSKTIIYYGNPESSCLVEKDEEPPHDLDINALNISLQIALLLKSNIFSEIYPMRKTVIDGSNTTGFQRTMLISEGGSFEVDEKIIGIQSICLEEDAAKILGEVDSIKKYSLERLGIPLVEIATEPFEVDLKKIKKIALSLGRLLRGTRKVKRGIGTIRQDVNISIRDGGIIVEVKGVQQLDQLEKVVEYEAKRQAGLIEISKKLQNRNWVRPTEEEIIDVTNMLKNCKSSIVQKTISEKQQIMAILFRNMNGMFSYSPYQGIRLGKDIAEIVRFFGIGGIFHSDELPNYGIEKTDIDSIKKILDSNENDGFLIIAGPKEKISIIIDQIIDRIKTIKDNRIPRDTRLATQSGETKFLRPRPGASRMYPETDIPPVTITREELEIIRRNLPKSWDESIKELMEKYGLNLQLAEQILDSQYLEVFEDICKHTSISPTFISSILCSTITNLERNGKNSQLLKNKEIMKSFELLSEGKLAKESLEIIYENIMDGKSKTVEDAIKNTSLGSINQQELEKIIEQIIEKNLGIINKQKEHAIGPLMGIAMKELRGRISGESLNEILLEKIRHVLNS